MIVLGIDYGDRRIGIAKSDSLGFLASGLDTIIRKDKKMETAAIMIKAIVEKYKVDKIVIGYPKNMDGTIGKRALITEDFVKVLKEHIDIEIILWDERLSSKAAHRTMHEIGIKTGHNKGRIDKIAACHILQAYLDSK